MSDDLVERLRRWAFKFCGKGEQEGLASDAMSEAADRIEQLENVLQEIARIPDIPETPPTKIGAETDIMWGCLVMCTFMARGAMGELDEQ